LKKAHNIFLKGSGFFHLLVFAALKLASGKTRRLQEFHVVGNFNNATNEIISTGNLTFVVNS